MSIIRPFALGLVALAIGSAAQALPTKTLYVQATRFFVDDPNAKGPLYYVGYEELKADSSQNTGFQIVAMEEAVADELSTLPESKMMACEARAFRNGRDMYVYALSNCH